MPVSIPSIAGQVPHDVEQAILALKSAVDQLQAEVARLRSQQPPTDAVARNRT
jgi:hypothetical protein